ncbi:MAG: 1-phosphofructokinase family hexose kinase [Chitinophagaceae bacterium]
MSRILTVTFSPCIDKSTSAPSLIPDKKLRCSRPVMEPGGGGINVARAIKKLGGETTAVFPSGGYSGVFFNQLMHDEQVSSVIVETVATMRENIIIREESTNRQYRFGMPSTNLTVAECTRMLQAIRSADDLSFMVISGSIGPDVPVNIFAQIANIAREKNAKLVVDTSGEALKNAIKEDIYFIKPSIHELASLVNKSQLLSSEVEMAARQVLENSCCKNIVVSMGNAGALLVTKTRQFTVAAPLVKVKSTVGAGDSMVAGIVFALSDGQTLEEALQYGVAAGTAATMNAGTGLCKKADVEKLVSVIRKSYSSIEIPVNYE